MAQAPQKGLNDELYESNTKGDIDNKFELFNQDEIDKNLKTPTHNGICVTPTGYIGNQS